MNGTTIVGIIAVVGMILMHAGRAWRCLVVNKAPETSATERDLHDDTGDSMPEHDPL